MIDYASADGKNPPGGEVLPAVKVAIPDNRSGILYGDCGLLALAFLL